MHFVLSAKVLDRWVIWVSRNFRSSPVSPPTHSKISHVVSLLRALYCMGWKPSKEGDSTIHLCGHQAHCPAVPVEGKAFPHLLSMAQLSSLPTRAQGLLPLVLLASLPSLLSFQAALKVTWRQPYLKQTSQEADQLYKFINLGNKHPSNYSYFIQIWKISSSLRYIHKTSHVSWNWGSYFHLLVLLYNFHIFLRRTN